jgi:hypothetical protein
LERLAAYLHICAKNVNQRIERYAEVIASLQAPHSKDAPAVSVELTKAEIDEMKQALDGKIYELTARRRNYLILRLDSFLSDGAATYDPTLLTIEHVLPQTVSDGSEWAKLWPDPDGRKNSKRLPGISWLLMKPTSFVMPTGKATGWASVSVGQQKIAKSCF